MKMQVKEFAELTGVSVRTLHYYDEIGLLKPSEVDAQTGYRFYDEKSLERMQEMMHRQVTAFMMKNPWSVCRRSCFTASWISR